MRRFTRSSRSASSCRGPRADAQRALEIARRGRRAAAARGAGTSQCGQTVGAALVHRHEQAPARAARARREARNAPGWSPASCSTQLNARLKPHGLWYPVDVSTAAQATLGGMTGEQQLRLALAALRQHGAQRARGRDVLAERRDGDVRRVARDGASAHAQSSRRAAATTSSSRSCARCTSASATRSRRACRKVLRRVAGYNLDMADRRDAASTWRTCWSARRARSATSAALKLKLAPLPRHKALGIVHFPTFYQAMEATQHIVKLGRPRSSSSTAR